MKNEQSNTTGQIPLTETGETVQLTDEQFRACLAALARQAGSMAELAARCGVSGQFMGDVIAGRKRAGEKLLGAFGAREVRMIEMPLYKGGEVNEPGVSEQVG